MNHVAMTTKKLNTELSELKQKVQTLRSLLIGFLGQDKEGAYRPKFVKKIFKAVGEETEFVFKDERVFLSQMKKGTII